MSDFVKTVEQLADGRTVVDLNDALLTLVAAVRHTGKRGSLVFSLTVKPASKGDGHALILDDDVKLKLPVAERAATILFANETNELSRSDPRQPELTGLRRAFDVTPFREREVQG